MVDTVVQEVTTTFVTRVLLSKMYIPTVGPECLD